MKFFILSLLLFSSCNVLKTITDGETNPSDDFYENDVVESLSDSLISFWKFDESGSSEDRYDSTNTNSFNWSTGNLTSISGQRGNAIDCSTMNASNHFSSLTPVNLDFGYSADFTIAFWLKVNSASSGNIFIMDGSPQGIQITYNNQDISAWYDGFSLDNFGYISSYGTWYHFTFVFDRDSNITAYRNGSYINSAAHDSTGTDFINNNIRVCTNAAWTVTSDIAIDSLGIWGRMLTEGEISALYNGNNNLD